MERYFPVPTLPRDFYEQVRAKRSQFRLVEEFIIPKETGKGFVVKRGHTVRFVIIEGPQIVDMDVFNAHDPSEHLWANQTLNREAAWLTTFHRLWGNMPRFRPLMTIIEDTVRTRTGSPWYGDGDYRHHHIVGAHCTQYFWLVSTGKPGHSNCYENLVSAIRPFGLGPEHVHDNLNLFQKAKKDVNGAMSGGPSDAVVGDYVEFYAEIDVLVAASLCPQGSAKTLPTDPFQDVHPMKIEIYETDVEPLEFSYDQYIKLNPATLELSLYES